MWQVSRWASVPLPFSCAPCFDQGIPRKDARNVNPTLSSDARDKLLAALSWSYGKLKGSAEYQKAPMYFGACLEWHERLSPDQQETCRTLADILGSAHKHAAESIAAAAAAALSALIRIVLQNSWEDTFGATIESETRMQRIEVALRHSATNQCCAIEPAKYFCNTIISGSER